MKKNRMDKTSIIMIGVFAGLIVASVVAAGFVGVKRMNERAEQNNSANQNETGKVGEIEGIMNNLSHEEISVMFPDAKPGDTYSYVADDGTLKTITIPDDYKGTSSNADGTVSGKVEASVYKYDNYLDLTDKFIELCEKGDVESLYDLYWDDGLTKMRENMTEKTDKASFDASIKSIMLSINGFDEYEYGGPELPPTSSPASYAAYIYWKAYNGAEFPLSETDIENCVNLAVYMDGGQISNHFMIQVGGYWYFLV